MSAYQTTQALQGLRAVLARIREDETRFRPNPISAVGLFLERHGLSDRHALGDTQAVAEFLGVPPSHLRQVVGVTFAHRDTAHDGPYFVFLPARGGGERHDAQARISEQVEALDRYLPLLQRLTRQFPPPARGMIPPEPEGWWPVLFHLAIHHPRSFLEASRERWVNVTGPAPHAVGGWRQTFPRATRVAESVFQLHGFLPPAEDLQPGVIWSQLAGDVFTATAAAVELLIERLEQPLPQPPDPDEVRRQFAALHAQFAEYAERDRRRPRPAAGHPPQLDWGGRCLLVKVADSFRTPPAREWCGCPLDMAHEQV